MSKMTSTRNSFIIRNALTISVMAFLLIGLIVMLIIVSQRQEIRKKAAVPTGPATLVLVPGSSNLLSGNIYALELVASIQNLPVDGFQVVANFTGVVPANLNFQLRSIQGLRVVTTSLTPTPTGVNFKAAWVTQDPEVPFVSIQPVNLGQFVFTAPANGTLTMTFDQILCKIIQNQTSQDILTYPQTYVYNFVIPSPTPTPTPTPSPTPRPTPTPTPRATPSPTPTPRATPTPTPTPRPTPIGGFTSPSPLASLTPTPRPTPTPTPRPTPTPTPIPRPTPTPSPSPSATPTPTPRATPTPSPTPRATPTPTLVPSPTPGVTPTTSPTPPSMQPNPSPTSSVSPPVLIGDLNHDGYINGQDVLLLIFQWWTSIYDLILDGKHNAFDFAVIRKNWTQPNFSPRFTPQISPLDFTSPSPEASGNTVNPTSSPGSLEQQIQIDIVPDSQTNYVDAFTTGSGKTYVALLSTPLFATPVDIYRNTLKFGRTGTEDSLHITNSGPACETRDINADQLVDLECAFYSRLTGFLIDDTLGWVRGETYTGVHVKGSDTVIIRP